MIEQKDVDVLNEALRDYFAAEVRLRQVCASLAGDGRPSSAEIALGATVEKPAHRRSGRQAKAGSPTGRRGGRPKNPKKRAWRPHVQCKCSVCQKVINGSKEIGGQFYPYGHDNAVGTPCSGSDKPGTPIMPADQNGNQDS